MIRTSTASISCCPGIGKLSLPDWQHDESDQAQGRLRQLQRDCQFRIELRHTDPLIWREVEVATSITLKVLHDIIQVVMGWFDCHLWEFTIGNQRYGVPVG
jgi:hypothetical protein